MHVFISVVCFYVHGKQLRSCRNGYFKKSNLCRSYRKHPRLHLPLILRQFIIQVVRNNPAFTIARARCPGSLDEMVLIVMNTSVTERKRQFKIRFLHFGYTIIFEGMTLSL